MTMTGTEIKAMAASFLRVLLATVLTVYLGLADKNVASWGRAEWAAFGAAVVGALATTVVNFLRRGETRFGLKAQDPAPPAPPAPPAAPAEGHDLPV